MRSVRNSQSGHLPVMAGIALAIILLGGVGLYVLKTSDKAGSPNSTPKAPASTYLSENQKIPPNTPSAELKTYKSEVYGIELQIPNDWTEQNTPELVILTGQDINSNLEIQLIISKGTQVGLSCNQVSQDSTDLVYSNPLPGQRKVTKLTYVSIDPMHKSLCSIMITGSFTAKKGDVIDILGSKLQTSLPTNRIVAQIHNMDNPTNFPENNKVFNSPKYTELMTTLKTIQVK